MHGVIYLVGLVVVVMAVLSFVGLGRTVNALKTHNF